MSETPAALLRRAADVVAAGDGPDWATAMTNEDADLLAAWLRAEADCAEALPDTMDALEGLAEVAEATVTGQPAAGRWKAKIRLSTTDQAVAFALAVLGETEKAL